MARSSRLPGTLRQEGFHDPVFERMERHDHQPASRLENLLGRTETGEELCKLVVDEDAQCLKGSGRRMNDARTRMHDARDDFGKRARGSDRRSRSSAYDGTGDGTGIALL